MAISLLGVGSLLFAGALIAAGFDFTKLNTAKHETNTYEIREDFSKMSLDTDTAEIKFVLSEHEQCKVVCVEREDMKHAVSVKNGTLTIATVDTSRWYDHIGFFFDESRITVYLPKREYASLWIRGGTGDIEIPGEFTFGAVDISASTGDVRCYASTSEQMKIGLSTGDIRVEDVSVGALELSVTTGAVTVSSVDCEGDIDVAVSTGKATLRDVSCRALTSRGSTGAMILKNVIAAESFSIKRSTGAIRLEGSDAGEIYVKTSTGSVKGTLLSEKVFITETNTGRIRVPKSVNGGRCEIKTSTGDIDVDIQ